MEQQPGLLGSSTAPPCPTARMRFNSISRAPMLLTLGFLLICIKHSVGLEAFNGRELRKPVNYFE